MEKEFLAEAKRFQQIMEYVDMSMSEDDKDSNIDPNTESPAQPEADPMSGGPMGADPMSGGPMGGDPMGGAPAGPDAGPIGGAPEGDDTGATAPEGFNPQPGAADAAETPDFGGENQPGPDDNVLEIDDLTNAQDEANNLIQGMDAKFDKLIGTLDKFFSAVEANDEKINALKQELEKRNPTPIEKLDLRSVNDSFPYNVKPTDFWKEKEETSNYRVGGDDENTPKQYELHQSDIDDGTDWKSVSDSLDDNDYISDLEKILNY